MSNSSDAIELTTARLIDCGVIAVVRLDSPDNLVAVAQALAAGGVDAIELTLTTPGAVEAITAASQGLGGDVLIGAGTVLTVGQAAQAVAAGARFLVAPVTDPAVIDLGHEAGAAVVPGALSPDEIYRAMTAGADIVKLFPGRVATPGYFTDILGPFPAAKLMVTGNVSLDTLPQYIAAGAVAVGVGKALVDPQLVRAGDWAGLTERAGRFAEAVRQARAARGAPVVRS